MTASAGALARSFAGVRMVTPGDWTDLDLDPATRHTSIARAVRRAVGRDAGLSGSEVRLIGLLDDIARRAYDSGAFFCSSLVLSSDAGGLLAANVLIQLADLGLDDPVLGASGMELCAGLAAAISCDPDWEDADVTVVTLPAVGEAVRVEVVAGGICLQYLIPLPDSSAHLLLTFTSPCPPFVEALIPLFDAMAQSLSLEYELPSAHHLAGQL